MSQLWGWPENPKVVAYNVTIFEQIAAQQSGDHTEQLLPNAFGGLAGDDMAGGLQQMGGLAAEPPTELVDELVSLTGATRMAVTQVSDSFDSNQMLMMVCRPSGEQATIPMLQPTSS